MKDAYRGLDDPFFTKSQTSLALMDFFGELQGKNQLLYVPFLGRIDKDLGGCRELLQVVGAPK